MEEGNKIRNKADRTMTKLDDIYVETAKKILDRMFPHEDEMELEYQFLAAKFAVAKTCEVEAEIQVIPDEYCRRLHLHSFYGDGKRKYLSLSGTGKTNCYFFKEDKYQT